MITLCHEFPQSSRTMIAVEFVKLVSSIRLRGKTQEERIQEARNGLCHHRASPQQGNTPDETLEPTFIIVVSQFGIRICSKDGSKIHMNHPLHRISFATADIQSNRFAFNARKTGSAPLEHFCHVFSTESPKQTEDLNNIVGNAFRLAYAAQMQRSVVPSAGSSPSEFSWTGESTPSPTQLLNPAEDRSCLQSKLRDRQQKSRSNSKEDRRVSKPRNIPGLNGFASPVQSDDENLSPGSPTAVNTCLMVPDKPELNKKLILPQKEKRGYSHGLTTTNLQNRLTDSKTSLISSLCDKEKDVSLFWSDDSKFSLAPPLPERTDSLSVEDGDETFLRCAPWYQAGIPREIALEVLALEPVGSFLVRKSTTKPGCYALTLRVPKEFHKSGVAHYLVLKTQRGYKIKGFTKEFPSLATLIIHHSVMPELLPCPLRLGRTYETDVNEDFLDVNSEPDYDALTEFRQKMADLNV